MTDFYLARQPIHDKNNALWGYDLLFHSNELNKPLLPREVADPAQILVSALLELGLSEVVGDKLAFINLTKRYVLGELSIPLARKQIVLEIHQDILPGHSMLNAFKQLKLRHAYTLALDAYEYDPTKTALVPLVDYVKIDVAGLYREQIEDQLELLGRYQGKRLAVGVNDYDLFDTCRELGFDYFQGFYFCHTHFNLKYPLPDNKTSALNLIRELQAPNLNQSRLQSLTARDISLGKRILRFINSPKYNLARNVNDIPQAISLFGIRCVANWITILVMARINDKADEIMSVSLIRARMCELLGKAQGLNTDLCFTLGLISILDALFDMEFSDIEERVPFSKELYTALHSVHYPSRRVASRSTEPAIKVEDSTEAVAGTENATANEALSPLAAVLQCVICYEHANWGQALFRSLPPGLLADSYFDALTWASGVRRDLIAESV